MVDSQPTLILQFLAITLAGAGVIAGFHQLTARLAHQANIERLATDPGLYSNLEVREYGRTIAQPVFRQRIALWFVEVLRDAGRPGTLYLADRVRGHEQQLRMLVQDLQAGEVEIPTPTMAACAQLLTAAADSPLYNPNLPAEQLMATLFRIRVAMRRTTPKEPSGPTSTGPQ